MASNKELFEALRLLEKEKGIPVEYMISQISKAIVSASLIELYALLGFIVSFLMVIGIKA